jgi:transcriptional regulator with GAF, ATPase, and Fis domain
VLQEQEFERVGGTRTLRTDVRMIAATNRDLQVQAAAARFRPDLFYRLNVFPIVVPPLRERRDDIAALLHHFATKTARKLGRPLAGVAPEFIVRATAYDWPGNIRELQNLVERTLIMAGEGQLDGSDLLPTAAVSTALAADPSTPVAPDGSLEDVERAHIRRVLERTRWVIEGSAGAARVLGLNPSTLRGRMRKLGITKTS